MAVSKRAGKFILFPTHHLQFAILWMTFMKWGHSKVLCYFLKRPSVFACQRRQLAQQSRQTRSHHGSRSTVSKTHLPIHAVLDKHGDQGPKRPALGMLSSFAIRLNRFETWRHLLKSFGPKYENSLSRISSGKSSRENTRVKIEIVWNVDSFDGFPTDMILKSKFVMKL